MGMNEGGKVKPHGRGNGFRADTAILNGFQMGDWGLHPHEGGLAPFTPVLHLGENR
jgi:hypothetical protein